MPIRVGEPLSLEDVVEVASGAEVALGSGALGRIGAARDVVERAVASNATVYGVTTGFGSLANERIEPQQADALQLGIVRSHATAVGPPLSREEARAMLLLRAHVLALGHSGVRAEVVERMVEMLNRDLVPVVPQQGSLGASGDLAPLANLALPLVGRGELLVDGEPKPAGEVLRSAGLEPLELKAKEGLALVNGTQGMLAIGILAVSRAERLVRTADVTAAMSVEAALGSDRVFDERLTALRPHPGVVASASNLRRLLEGSAIVASHRDSTHLVQDAYSLRCSPQVNGATREVLRFVRGVLEVEANAVSDNPIVLPDDDEVLSGGNFHGQPVAVALDALAAALVPLASIAERRLYRLLDPTRNNGLPAFLVADSGLNSGLHARAVHGGVARVRVQDARAPGLGRFDRVERRAGGPREHGDDGRAARARGGLERRGRDRARGARRGAGARPQVAAPTGGGDRSRSRRDPSASRVPRCRPRVGVRHLGRHRPRSERRSVGGGRAAAGSAGLIALSAVGQW